MSFDKHSNFNKQANFTEVKFGENKPVLEVELNELQQIQNEARADIIRDSIPSGFTQLGDIDYEYCLNNENKIKLKTDSVAYVNGYRINIPKDTIIDIGKAPEKDAREDLLFLEVWKEEVNSTSTLYKEGGEGQASISNNIKDSRYPIETTHRVALRWRIRHVADVDFNRYHMDGFSAGTHGRNRQVTAQGGSDKPFTPTFDTDATGSFNRSDLLHLNDKGLFVTSQNAELFKTFDGYVYAIPMFRLYRKPSCGKSIPFEYSKINPKVDYGKFTKLIKEDKVERVVTENIKGRSLVNCAYSTSINLTKNLYSPLTRDGIIKSNTEYTLCFNISNITGSATGKILRLIIRPTGGSDDTSNDIIINVTSSSFTTGKVKVKIPSQTVSIARLYIHLSGGAEGDSIALTDVMILEDDWTNKEIPTLFTGLKSLGEDDGNLITIKNGILNDDTYDINDGNQKLLAFSEVTHVNSTNTIIPTIEANVIKGEESTPLEKLGSKLETEGHEVIEFTKIKGRTLQNIYPTMEQANFSHLDGTIEGKYVSLVANGSFKNAWIPLNKCVLKPSTTYTVFLDITKNSLDSESNLSQALTDNNCFNEDVTISASTSGLLRYKLTTKSSLNENMSGLRLFIASTSGTLKFRVYGFEGDHMNIPLEELPFVEGIKSVGETEGNTVNLTSVGKNLISKDMYTNKWLMYDNINADFTDSTGKLYSIYGIKPCGATKLVLSCNKSFNRLIYRGRDSANNVVYYGSLGAVNITNHTFENIPSNVVTLDLYVHAEGIDYTYDFMLEEGEVVNPYKPYQRYNQNIYLREPLRSLPNGVCDEIVGNKVIRRVGKVVLNGSEPWTYQSQNSGRTNTLLFTCKPPSPPKSSYYAFKNVLSDRFYCNEVWTIDSPGIYTDATILGVAIYKNDLSDLSVSGFNSWLKLNPTTVYYELATPIEEYLVNVYEKESIKTYQLDAPLRSLPNGVKDEIKDGVLIRRCGAYTFTGNEGMNVASGGWENATMVTTFEGGVGYPTNCLYSSYSSNKLLCNTFNWNDFSTQFVPAQSGSTGIRGITTHELGKFVLSINKSELSSQDWEGMSAWLKDNPTTVIYQLATPTETILTEAKPQTTDFSLQRQFGEGNYLRELPNGVKDTIENGKVIRRTTKLTLNGSELWELHSNNTTDGGTLYRYFLPLNTTSAIGTKQDILICDKLKVVNDVQQEIWSCENIHYRIDSNRAGLYIVRNNITTLQDFKSWLTNNPVSIITLLATPTEEELTNENCNYFPVHDFNTYCGSMYVGEGRNYVISDNKMPSEDTIVETDFREIEGKAKVEDCNFKKNDEGYDTMCLLPTNKNLFDGIWEKGMINTDGSIYEIQSTTRKYSKNFIRVIPGKTYVFSTNLGEDRINLKGYDLNKKLVHNFSYSNKHTIPEGCYFVRFYNGHDSSVNLDDIKAQFELGETATSYVEGINTFRSFENTEENDVDDLRHQVSLTGFNYDKILNESFDKLLRGEL